MSGPKKVLRQKPPETCGWHLGGTALGSRVQVCRGVRVTKAPPHWRPSHIISTAFSTCPRDFCWFVFGTRKGEGGFHRSSSFTIKCLKSTVSEEEEEGQTSHTCGTQTSRQRQTGRPHPHPHTHARRPFYSHSHLISLLCSQPWSTWGLEAGRGPCNHTKSTSPALDHQLREGGLKRRDFAYSCIFGRQLF